MRDLNEICEPTTNFSTLVMDLNFCDDGTEATEECTVFR